MNYNNQKYEVFISPTIYIDSATVYTIDKKEIIMNIEKYVNKSLNTDESISMSCGDVV